MKRDKAIDTVKEFPKEFELEVIKERREKGQQKRYQKRGKSIIKTSRVIEKS